MTIMYHTNSKYKKRERTQNWAYEEKKFLLELCRKDMHIIENKRLDSALTSLKNRAWRIIHQQFCQTFGTDRNCNRLKEQWRRMKACTRAEMLDYQHRINKFGQEIADKKKPSQFSFDIWEFMTEAKKVCKNESLDDVDYTKVKLALEENLPLEEQPPSEEHPDGTDDSNNSSNWARTSQNMCEVQLSESPEHNTTPNKRQRTISNPHMPDLHNIFSGIGLQNLNSDLFNLFKNQYLNDNYQKQFIQNQDCLTNGGTDNRNGGGGWGGGVSSEVKHKEEHSIKLEILQVELETAKINRDIAEINKQIVLKRLSKENT